jgi:hypothetical protein
MAPPIRRRQRPAALVQNVAVSTLIPDAQNPRKADDARLGLLRLSLSRLGFIQPVFADSTTGLLLSGHQRTRVAQEMGITQVPVCYIDPRKHDIHGANIGFNRATNDLGAFDTGSKLKKRLEMDDVIKAAEALPLFEGEEWFALQCTEVPIAPLLAGQADKHDPQAVSIAASMARMGIRIPLVASQSGRLVNGIYRAFAAAEAGLKTWPTVVIPDAHAEVAAAFLNYLSMDFAVNEDFKAKLRYSAFRRPQNNRGELSKAYRFWADGERVVADKDSYSTEYWLNFRTTHGRCLDFGAGLCKIAPLLNAKGIDCLDFEPFRIDPSTESGVPSPEFSRQKAREFLQSISDPSVGFDSIFLSSVLNSVPFPEDRMCVLAIVNALSARSTTVYGTCRDLSDFNYQYGGIRVANYFTFDSEHGVRLGDTMRSPKLQKFESPDTLKQMTSRLWLTTDTWPGGNIFYWRAKWPKQPSPTVLGKALEFEFGNIPFSDGTTMGLAQEAKDAFSRRLGKAIP